MTRVKKMALVFILVAAVVAAGCQRNYYTSKAKGNDCGCPAKKGMVGY
jgi:hypothetical protein